MVARRTRKTSCTVGVDEAGCGCLAGPVVAAALVLNEPSIDRLTDSKRLSPTVRGELFQTIIARAKCYAIALATHYEIDQINILRARLLAMQRAVQRLQLTGRVVVEVDGNRLPELNHDARAVIGGDATVPVISAASVLAKVYRDRLMERYHALYPNYQFARHKGYPTQVHLAVIKRYGLSEIHRRSFRPCRSLRFDLFSR